MAGRESIKIVKIAVLVAVSLLSLITQAQTLSIQRVTRVIVDGEVGSSYEVQFNDDINNTNGWKTGWIVDVKSTELLAGIIDDSTNLH